MSTTRRSRLRKIGVMSLVSGVITLGLSLTTATPASADVTTVEGDATALLIGGTPVIGGQASGEATAPQLGYGPIGTGELPAFTQNGNVVPGVDCATGVAPGLPPVPGLTLDIGLLEACTRGGNVGTHQGFAQSQARVLDLELLGADLGVITTTCVADGDGVRGATAIVGSPLLPANPTPGQVVTVPIQVLPAPVPPLEVTVVLNEQIVPPTLPPPNAVNEITVNGLRITVLGITIIAAQSHCRAEGPDVNLPDGGVTTTQPPGGPTTTAAPGPGGGVPPINNNNNNNQNNNENTSTNENNNTTDNTNTNDNTNTQDQTQTNDQTNEQSQTNSQTQQGGNNTNSNVITITNVGSNFDDFHRRGRFHNDHDGHHGHTDHGGDHHFGKALARTGSESSRLTGVALLLMVVGAVLVLGTRTVTAEAAAVPGARASRRLRRRR